MEQIEQVAIGTLIPYENNARVHSDSQLTQIANSIKKFGFINPITVDENNLILSGHGRYQASKQLNLKTVPVKRVTHLSDKEKKAYILLDNKIALNASWDETLLKTELGDIPDELIEMIGFDEFELELLTNGWENNISKVDDIEAIDSIGLKKITINVDHNLYDEVKQNVITFLESYPDDQIKIT